MSSKLKSARPALVVGVLLLTCGCRTAYVHHIGDEDPGLGETSRFNAAAQIINPDPIYPSDGAQPGDSGAKAAAAVTRYRTDKVKAVETLSTETSTEGGSGSSGSGSSGGSTR